MPSSAIADVQSLIYEAFRDRHIKRARDIHHRLLSLLLLYNQYGTPLAKLVLERRGVISSTTLRDPQGVLSDMMDQVEVARLLEELEPLFTVK